MIGNFKHQLCRGTVKHIEKGGLWLGQPKLDGMRVAIFKKDGQPYVLSRNLKQQPFVENYSWIINGLEECGIDLERNLIDGEVTADTRFTAIGLSHRQSPLTYEERQALILEPFDILDIETVRDTKIGMVGWSNRERLDELARYMLRNKSPNIKPVDYVPIHTRIGAEEYYESLLAQGHEGAVFKDAKSMYRFGNSQFWVKMKADFDEDLPVIRAIEGVGKFAGTLGAFVVNRNGVEVHVGSFQIDDTERYALWQQRESLVGKVIEVRHFGATPAGSLSHPIFICVRWDKS